VTYRGPTFYILHCSVSGVGPTFYILHCSVSGVGPTFYILHCSGSGVGPIFYIVHESDLQLLSIINLLLKYADDTNLLVPEHTDISLSEEFAENVKKWACNNKMVINYNKTKELVFRRPNPRHYLYPDPIPYIEQLNEVKLLGVVISFHGLSTYCGNAANGFIL